VFRAPAITLGVLAALFLLALPLGLALRGMLVEHLGSGVVSERAAYGWDAGWAAEFGAQAQGIGRTFTHEILGFGGTLSIVGGFFDAKPLPPAVAGTAAVFVVLWTFLSGGILDRFARAPGPNRGLFCRVRRLFLALPAAGCHCGRRVLGSVRTAASVPVRHALEPVNQRPGVGAQSVCHSGRALPGVCRRTRAGQHGV